MTDSNAILGPKVNSNWVPHKEIPRGPMNKQAAVEIMWEYLQDAKPLTIFSTMFKARVINLEEFDQCNYYAGVYTSNLQWDDYNNYKATILMLLLAELGELK